MKISIIYIFLVCTFSSNLVVSQTSIIEPLPASFALGRMNIQEQFLLTSAYLDAAINSLNSFNSLIKKENYRNRISSFNNPTSSELGFNLENEIQNALRPLLAKAKNINIDKFGQVISSLISKPSTNGTNLGKSTITGANPIFYTLISLVGNLTVHEKKITREDLDSFILSTSKYFLQYEKLNQANLIFDQNIEKLNNKLLELNFDLKEYLLDLVIILKGLQRSNFKNSNIEEIYLNHLDHQKLKSLISEVEFESFKYPSDGIKTAKEITNNLQKLFIEYQKLYTDNYQQIKSILIETKKLGKNINILQVDASLKELETLYMDSKNADVLSLRLSTLAERLRNLVATEQKIK